MSSPAGGEFSPKGFGLGQLVRSSLCADRPLTGWAIAFVAVFFLIVDPLCANAQPKTINDAINELAGVGKPDDIQIAPMVTKGSPTPGPWTTLPNDLWGGLLGRSGITPGASTPRGLQGRPGFLKYIKDSEVVVPEGSRATFGYFVQLGRTQSGDIVAQPGNYLLSKTFFILMSYDLVNTPEGPKVAFEVFVFAGADDKSTLLGGYAVTDTGQLLNEVPIEIANQRLNGNPTTAVSTGVGTEGYGCLACHSHNMDDLPQETGPFPWTGGFPDIKKGPPQTSMIVPPINVPGTTYAVSTGTDGGAWCTYGDGTGSPVVLGPYDGPPLTVSYTPPVTVTQDGGSITPSSPVTPGGSVPGTTTTPPVERKDVPTASAAPRAPDAPPANSTTSDPPQQPAVPQATNSPIPPNVYVKAKEYLLNGGDTGTPIQGQTVKLFPTDKPDLPAAGATQAASAARDDGASKDPPTCTTGADGTCAVTVAAEDRPLYGLPPASNALNAAYRVDIDVPKTSGVVLETTRKSTGPNLLKVATGGTKVSSASFKIGDRSFVRVALKEPYDAKQSARDTLSGAYGGDVEEDYCRDKQPGPPMGSQPESFSALNRELPEAKISLRNFTPVWIHAR